MLQQNNQIQNRKALLTVFAICLIAIVCTCAAFQTVWAAEKQEIALPAEGGNLYFDKETGAITHCDKDITEALIPQEIDGVAVRRIGSKAFYNCKKLKNIQLPDGITHINALAFRECKSLINIEIPNTVTHLGKQAFHGCSSLSSIRLPDAIPGILEHTFSYCKNLKHVKLPAHATVIEKYAFFSCENLTDIQIPSSVTSIGYRSFAGCSKLERITIPAKVRELKDRPFYNCKKLKHITVKTKKLTSKTVGQDAFKGTYPKASVKVPKSKFTSYKKLFYSKGLSLKAKVKRGNF